MRKLITIMMVLFASIAMAQTQSTLPVGSVSYSGNLFIDLSGNVWTGKAGSYTNLGTWLKVDSLVNLGYTNAQIDSIVADLGLPTGGTTNQFLKKNSNTDGDAKWEGITGADLGNITSTNRIPVWTGSQWLSNGILYSTSNTNGSIAQRNLTGALVVSPATNNNEAVVLSQLNDSLATKFNQPTGTTSQYIRGDGSLATMPEGAAYTAGAGLTLDGTEFSLPVTQSGSGDVVTSVVQNANGLTVTKGTVGGGASNLALGTRTTTTMPITNSNGTGVTLPAATPELAGLITAGAQSFSGLKGFQNGISLENSNVNNGIRFVTTNSAIYRASGQRLVVQSGEELYLQGTNNGQGIGLYLTGGINSSALAGPDTRMVVADAGGTLSTQTIPSASGTVTSVGLSLPTGFSVSGSPVTSSGTLTGTWASGYQAYTTTEASKLSGIAAGAEVNVNADWNASSGDAQILNKPASLPPSGSAGGDLTGSYPNPTIASQAVTYGKMQNMAGLSVLGRSANSTGVMAAITAGTDNHVLRRSGTTIGFGTINASAIGDGTIATARLGSGAANSGTVLHGDGTWKAISGGSQSLQQVTDVGHNTTNRLNVIGQTGATPWDGMSMSYSSAGTEGRLIHYIGGNQAGSLQINHISTGLYSYGSNTVSLSLNGWANVASFSSRVQGQPAVQLNEFVTKSQLDAATSGSQMVFIPIDATGVAHTHLIGDGSRYSISFSISSSILSVYMTGEYMDNTGGDYHVQGVVDEFGYTTNTFYSSGYESMYYSMGDIYTTDVTTKISGVASWNSNMPEASFDVEVSPMNTDSTIKAGWLVKVKSKFFD